MHSLFKDPRPEAALILSDGTVLLGRSFGASVSNVAEVVFNTAMTGYQEVLTDPSYTGQIVTLTGAHVGNVGVNAQDREGGAAVHAAGLVVRDVPAVHSNFRSEKSLPDYLVEQGVPAIAGVDTRRLTRILRTKGAQAGVIVVARNGALTEDEIDAGRKAVAAWKGMAGQDLAKVVTCKAPYEWTEGAFSMKAADGRPGFVTPAELPVHVVAYDFGVKTNILRMLVERGMRVTVVPAQTPVEDVLAMNPDGVFLSNGPGDPAPCTYAIEAAREIIARKIPLFGICLGHQIMGLAIGAKTLKMKFGHHGANHPVVDLRSRHVYITSQNHGFAVDAKTLPANAVPTHESLFDGSLQGFELTDAPAFCFQGHPEASPGPHDIAPLFDHFRELIERHRAALPSPELRTDSKRTNMEKANVLAALNDARDALDALISNEKTIEAVVAAAGLMADAVEGDGKVMSCGNGGSLCDAMHFAEEMTGRYRSNRRPYAALAISDASHMACVGNDYGYEEVFSRYVEAHGRKGDVLLAITTSGTSRNIVKAAEVARRKGVKVVALTGRDETPITELADVSIVTPAGRWADRVQELHIKCIHILIELIERRLDKQNYE